MQDHGLTVDQIINAGAFALCTVSLSRYKTNRITITKSHGSIAEEIGGVGTIRYRAAIIYDHTLTLVSTECNIIGRLYGINQILLLQIGFRRRMHTDASQLRFRIPQLLLRINKRRAGPVCLCTAQAGNIQDIRCKSGLCCRRSGSTCRNGTEYAIQNRDQFLLHITLPESCHQSADGHHRISARKCRRQIRCGPHLSTAKDCSYVLVGSNLVVLQIRTFNNLLRLTSQVFEERHVDGRCRLGSQCIESAVIGNDSALHQCGERHRLIDDIRVKKFRDNYVL